MVRATLEHVDFAAAIRAKSTRGPESQAALSKVVTLEDGLWSVAIGEAAHRSIAENRPVTLAEILG